MLRKAIKKEKETKEILYENLLKMKKPKRYFKKKKRKHKF